MQLRNLFSVVVIGLAFFLLAYLIMANKERALALAPQYQQSLLAAIQQVAVFFGVETEPTWSTLRQELLAQVNLQRLLTSLMTSVGSILVSFVVVFLYATFLLIERRTFDAKLANLSDDPKQRGAHSRGDRGDQPPDRLVPGAQDADQPAAGRGQLRRDGALRPGLRRAVGGAHGLPELRALRRLGARRCAARADGGGAIPGAGPILTLLLALTAAQFAIGNFLDPYVMGNSLNLSPFAILISLAVWTELWGIPGAFLAVPITAIITIVFSEFPATRPLAVLLSKGGRT